MHTREPYRAALAAIVAARRAVVPVAELPPEARALLEELTAAGLVERWDRDLGYAQVPTVTLTVLGAWRMHVEIQEHVEGVRSEALDEDGKVRAESAQAEVPHWAEAGSEPPPCRALRRPGMPARMERPEEVADGGPRPPEVLMDYHTGAPVTLWGLTIPIERRRGAKAGPRRTTRR